MTKIISRDPFARTEIHRHTFNIRGTCRWCGEEKPFLYGYRKVHDGGREEIIKGVFCSVGCMRSYHGS